MRIDLESAMRWSTLLGSGAVFLVLAPLAGDSQQPPAAALPFYSGPGCIELACRQLGAPACDTQEEILRIARLCQGNSGGCLQAACQCSRPWILPVMCSATRS